MKVPLKMKVKYEIIAPIITEFCSNHLNDEYAEVSLLLLEKLCRKRPSPLINGNPNTWACGIVYTIGSANFLFDRTQPLYMRAYELANYFGLSQSTASSKAREINRMLKIHQFDPNWTLPSNLINNPYVWLFENEHGFIFDVRHADRELQEDLYNAGKIPFIPADKDDAIPPEDEIKIEPKRPENTKTQNKNIALDGQTTLCDDLPEG